MAEHSTNCVVSFSARWNGKVRFYLSAEVDRDSEQICLRTWSPDKYPESQKLRADLDRAVPQHSDSIKEKQWFFSLPQESKEFVATARKVAEVLRKRFDVEAAAK
jgi:hypothetical protein